jgi:hypothetical protein
VLYSIKIKQAILLHYSGRCPGLLSCLLETYGYSGNLQLFIGYNDIAMCTTEIHTYVCMANARMTEHMIFKCDHYDPSQSCTTAMTIVYPEKDISEDGCH